MNTLKLNSYAKVNLALEIMGVENGYHTLDSLVASIDLFDKIVLKKRKDRLSSIRMLGLGSESIPPEHNNALKAAEAFSEAFDVNGVDITIYKNIPMGAGLGGSSADVAGVLNGMARLYKIDDTDGVKALAEQLGSDTKYMLTGGFARMQGRGEKITPIPSSTTLHVLLLCPDSDVSSRECYREYDRLQPQKIMVGATQKCIDALRDKNVNEIGRYLTNDLYVPAKTLNKDVEKALAEAESFSPLGAVMTGSGSCVLALFETKELCDWAKSRYRGKFRAIVTKTIQPNYRVIGKTRAIGWRNPFVISQEEMENATEE